MKYEEIYSQFYTKEIDATFFKKYTQDEAYELMTGWLHSIAALPYVRKIFAVITLDDELQELTFILNSSIDEDSDARFVQDVFAQGLAICWMRQHIDNVNNMALVIGDSKVKTALNNYKANADRLGSLERQLKKMIRDYGYYNNSYVGEQ